MNSLPNLNAERILVIEDDLHVAERLVVLLRQAGYYVQNAYNCGDAVAADHSRFDLALVDGAMHDRSGKVIGDYIRESRSFARLPVLAISREAAISGKGLALRTREDEVALLTQIKDTLREKSRSKVVRSPSHETKETPSEPARSAFDLRLKQQLDALKTLSALGRSISSVLDVNEVLNQIVEAATELTSAEEGLLLLPEDTGQTLYLRAMKGIDDASARNFRIKNENSLVGTVYQTGQPLLIGDQGLHRVKTEYFVKSLLYVPMIYQGRIIGVLGVNNRLSQHVFTEHDQELLLDLAAHAAIAIENARLYAESLLQNRQLSLLVNAGAAVNSKLALGDVLATICQQTIRALEVNTCQIVQQATSNDALYPLASTWQAAWQRDHGPEIGLDDNPVLKQALEQGAYYVVTAEMTGKKWQYELQLLKSSGAEQMLVLAIRAGAQPALGILRLYYRGTMPEVTGELRRQLRALALEICLIVAQRSAVLLSGALFANAQKLLEVANANWLTLWLLETDNRLTQIVEYGTAVYLSEPRPAVQPWLAQLDAQSTLKYHLRQPDLPEPVRAMMVKAGAKALLCLPLVIKGAVFGLVTICDTSEARSFRPDEIQLAQALITQTATAIENARLYRDLEQSLTELQLTQAKLVQTARLTAIGELAAIVAHQINNPLTTVISDAEMILNDLPSGDPMYEGIAAIHRAGKRSLTVVKRLLSNARRDAPDEKPSWINIYETFRNMLEFVTPYIERTRISLTLDFDESQPVYVYAHTGHLEDVWLNLLLNARDVLAKIKDATIRLYCRYELGIISVSVCDNGPGIQPEHLPSIFEPFFTTKPTGEGTGLGLYICKQVIEQCQGSIRVDTTPGQGTCFYVNLPGRTDG